MKRMGILKLGIFYFACVGMFLPLPALDAAQIDFRGGPLVPPQAPAGVDVELRPGGVLLGQVIDAHGIPPQGTVVSVRRLGREMAATETDQFGRFQVQGLRGGTYEIVAGQAHGVYRIWAPNTAPPLARPSALVVAMEGSVRGNQGPIGYWLGNPWVVAGLVAAAITVPIVIHNQRINRTTSP